MTSTVSVIVVTYNSSATIDKTLGSLLKQTYSAEQTRIIVVDNASTDETVSLVKRTYPQITVIETGRNTGFAGGNNIGMKAHPADYFALINPDAVIASDWIEKMVSLMDSDKSIGVAGGKIYYAGSGKIQHAGGMFRDNALTYHLGDQEEDIGQYDTLRDVEYVMGATLMTRGSVAKTLNYLPEAYFPAYFEEADFCYQVRKAGNRVVYVPDAVAWHDEAHSGSGQMTLKYIKRYHVRRFLFAMRNFRTPEERQRFLAFERDWQTKNAPGFQSWLMLTWCKLANWRYLPRNLWILRSLVLK